MRTIQKEITMVAIKSIEEKALAYDEAIERGKQIQNTPYTAHWDIMKEVAEHLLPELKESEDERIRGEIIDYLSTVDDKELIPYESWIAWLEKQGGQILANSAKTCKDWQKPVFEMKTPEESLGIESDTYNKIVDECIYGEQKSAETEKGAKGNEEEIPNSAWSEDDEEEFKIAIDTLVEAGQRDSAHWLKSLKDRVQPQPKQEWSEEDKDIINKILCICNDFERSFEMSPLSTKVIKEDVDKIDNWLKHLRPQSHWKPSDEQMQALSNAGNSFRPFEEGHKVLWSLYNDLKKLMEE